MLGGDCSILLGNLLALRRRGRYGLLFVDGHADFYHPEANPNGEAASMDLAFATGRGPEVLTWPDETARVWRATFSLDPAQPLIVWGDGQTTHREVIELADTREFGSKTFEWRTRANGWTWARVAVWDVAANGAFANPVWRR